VAGEVTDKYNRQAGAGSKQSVDVHTGRQPFQFLFQRQNSNRQVNQTIYYLLFIYYYIRKSGHHMPTLSLLLLIVHRDGSKCRIMTIICFLSISNLMLLFLPCSALYDVLIFRIFSPNKTDFFLNRIEKKICEIIGGLFVYRCPNNQFLHFSGKLYFTS